MTTHDARDGFKLDDLICRGMTCNHETNKIHYILDDSDVSSLLQSDGERLVGELESLKVKWKYREKYDDDGDVGECTICNSIEHEELHGCEMYNDGIDAAIARVRGRYGIKE